MIPANIKPGQTAKTAPKQHYDELHNISDGIEITLQLLNSRPNDENIQKLNGLWTRGRRMLVTPTGNQHKKKIA